MDAERQNRPGRTQEENTALFCHKLYSFVFVFNVCGSKVSREFRFAKDPQFHHKILNWKRSFWAPGEKDGHHAVICRQKYGYPKAQYCQRHPCTSCLSQMRNDSSTVTGPSVKLLAFGMNHAGVLGDDAKKVFSEQATVLSRHLLPLNSYKTFTYSPINCS